MILKATLSNPTTGKRVQLGFPAEYSEIEDALLCLDCGETVCARGRILGGYQYSDLSFNFEKCNVFELNYFANIVEEIEDSHMGELIGGFQILSQEPKMNAAKAINLAMNIQADKAVLSQPALDEYDLARFHLENDLIPVISEVSDEVYQWIFEHVDLCLLGEEICQKEHGTFISGAYVTLGELENLYDGNIQKPLPEDYVFRLEVAINENDKGNRYFLSLPATDSDINRMFQMMKVESLSQLTYYKFQSIVQGLRPMEFEMTDLAEVNKLAASIAELKEAGYFNTYKAIVEVLYIVDVETVQKICHFASEFELKPGDKDFASYGRNSLQNVVLDALPDDLIEYLETEEYGRKLAEKNGVNITRYGALVPKDGLSLTEKLRNLSEEQSQGGIMEQSM